MIPASFNLLPNRLGIGLKDPTTNGINFTLTFKFSVTHFLDLDTFLSSLPPSPQPYYLQEPYNQ